MDAESDRAMSGSGPAHVVMAGLWARDPEGANPRVIDSSVCCIYGSMYISAVQLVHIEKSHGIWCPRTSFVCLRLGIRADRGKQHPGSPCLSSSLDHHERGSGEHEGCAGLIRRIQAINGNIVGFNPLEQSDSLGRHVISTWSARR